MALSFGLLLLTKRFGGDRAVRAAMALGAGALLGAAFFDLLPEAFDSLSSTSLQPFFATVLGGFVLFFILERSFQVFHSHHQHDDLAKSKSQRSLLVIGNVSHRAMDGVALGIAFAVSPSVGAVVLIATAAHEIPRTIGDFGLLLSRGMSKSNVVLVHVLSSLLAILVAAVAFYLGDNALSQATPYILGVIAGTFIYVSAADIIPEIHERPGREANLQSAFLLAGIALIPLIQLAVS